MFIFCKSSGLAVGPTQPPIQWVPEFCSCDKGAATWCSLLTAIWWSPTSAALVRLHRVNRDKCPFIWNTEQTFWDEFNFDSRYLNSNNFLEEWLPVKRIGRVHCSNHAVTDYGLDDRGIVVRFLAGARGFCFFPKHPDRLWDRLSLLLNSYCVLFYWDKAAGVLGWPLISVWMPTLSMRVAIPPCTVCLYGVRITFKLRSVKQFYRLVK